MSNTQRFDVGGTIIKITEHTEGGLPTGHYSAEVKGQKLTGYHTSSGCHKAVLLTVLDDACKKGIIDHATANWDEKNIRMVKR